MTRERAFELAQNLDASISGGEWDRTDVAMVADIILAAVAEDTKEADAIIRMQASVILQLRLQLATAVAEERYACAKIAEDYCDENGDFIGGRIRARN